MYDRITIWQIYVNPPNGNLVVNIYQIVIQLVTLKIKCKQNLRYFRHTLKYMADKEETPGRKLTQPSDLLSLWRLKLQTFKKVIKFNSQNFTLTISKFRWLADATNKGSFTLNVSVCVYVFEYNGNYGNKTQTQRMGSVFIFCINVNILMDTILKFDVNADANVDFDAKAWFICNVFCTVFLTV